MVHDPNVVVPLVLRVMAWTIMVLGATGEFPK